MSTVSIEAEAVSARAWTLRKSQIRSTTKAVIAACTLFGLTLTANAAKQDDPVSNLRNFVQTMPAAAAQDATSITALGEFLRTAVPSTQPVTKVAATSMFDALQKLGQPPSAAESEGAAQRARAARAASGATLVDNKVCLTCHAAQAAEFDKTLMGRIGKTKHGMFDCQNCHGAGSEHVKAGGGRGVGGIMSFGETDPRTTAEKNAVCLSCHEKGERTAWKGSTHEMRGLACTNCHTIMKNVSAKYQLKTTAEMETCFQCHQQKRAQMERSAHMPVREGKLTCSNCHNPHGSVLGTEGMLRQASINDNCYSCHADKRGPLLWEHAPVRENCLNCHDPHGSNHESMLKIARPRLCAQCHGFAHGGQTGMNTTNNAFYTLQHSCNNCHSQIHGSNSPSGKYLHR